MKSKGVDDGKEIKESRNYNRFLEMREGMPNRTSAVGLSYQTKVHHLNKSPPFPSGNLDSIY